jgi:hypothetical protein
VHVTGYIFKPAKYWFPADTSNSPTKAAALEMPTRKLRKPNNSLNDSSPMSISPNNSLVESPLTKLRTQLSCSPPSANDVFVSFNEAHLTSHPNRNKGTARPNQTFYNAYISFPPYIEADNQVSTPPHTSVEPSKLLDKETGLVGFHFVRSHSFISSDRSSWKNSALSRTSSFCSPMTPHRSTTFVSAEPVLRACVSPSFPSSSPKFNAWKGLPKLKLKKKMMNILEASMDRLIPDKAQETIEPDFPQEIAEQPRSANAHLDEYKHLNITDAKNLTHGIINSGIERMSVLVCTQPY